MENSNAAGPGAITDQGISPRPLLEGATEYEVVTIFNPLSVDFYGLVGQSKPVNVPFEVRKDSVTNPITGNEEDVRRNYGLNLKNPNHQAKLPIRNTVIIRAGQTLKVFGNEAQVIVTQLVNEIMQRAKKNLLLADPYQRHQVEEQVVRSRQSTADAIGGVQSISTQMRDGVNKLNEQNYEPEFPGLETAKGDNSGSGSGAINTAKLDGRTKAAQARKEPA